MLTVTRTTLFTYNIPSASSPAFPVPLPAATSRALTRRAHAVAPPPAVQQQALLSFLPRPVKLALLAVLLANYRSLPGFWHLRVFRPIIALRLRALAFFTYVRLCILAARAARALRLPGVPPAPGILALGLPGARQQFMHSVAARALAARGGPLDAAVKTAWTGWASLDDCDWNMHLSNSAYNKNFDYARTDFLFAYLAPFFADGGLVALGHSEFHFVKEIGIGQSYKIETRIATWDGKWLYLVGRFLSRKTPAQRRKQKGKGKAKAVPGSGSETPTSSPRHVPFAVWPPSSHAKDATISSHVKDATISSHVKDAGAGKEGKGKDTIPPPAADLAASFTTAADYTDADADDIRSEVDSILSPDEAAARSSSTASRSGGNSHGRREKGDGHDGEGEGQDGGEWTLHAVGVSSYCFKHRASRRSVPPALVLAACGFGGGEGDAPSPWDRLQRMRHGGAAGDARRFWAGGWADEAAAAGAKEGADGGAKEAFWEPVARRWEEGRVAGMRELRRGV